MLSIDPSMTLIFLELKGGYQGVVDKVLFSTDVHFIRFLPAAPHPITPGKPR